MADDGIHELYGLDPGEFVAARNALARKLRGAGEREAAEGVARLRRPSPAAWAVNQLVRRHRGEVEELVRLGEALRDAQDRALAGEEPGDLRAAARARRDALARLAGQAERILAERGASPGPHAAEVGATLEAASLDPGAASAVLGGRLAAELQPPSGFGGAEGVAAEPRPRPAPSRAAEPEPHPDRRELEEAEAAADEARRGWDERSAQARAAVGRVAERRRQVDDAEAEVSRREDLLEEARRALRHAVGEAERAEDAAARAEEVAARAAERLRRADQRLAALRSEPDR